MTIVVKLGGTNGSGKTSVAREIIHRMGQRKLHSIEVDTEEGFHKVKYYFGKLNRKIWNVLGSYENVCGGMDTISNKFARHALVKAAIETSDVTFFEGLITGKTYGAFGAMSEEPQHKGKWVYAFMDTPYEVCVERVLARRAAARAAGGNKAASLSIKPFNPERTLLPTFKSVQAVAKRAAVQGHAVLWLPHNQTPKAIAEHLVKYVEEFANEKR